MSWLTKAREFFGEVKAEFDKVSFPSRQEVVGTTVVVMIASFIMAIYLYVADQVILQIYQFVIEIFT
jgi:preprotein translocase subunit SecE